MKYLILSFCLLTGCASYSRWNDALSKPESQRAIQNLSESQKSAPLPAKRETNCVTRERKDFQGRSVYYTDCD